MMHGGRQSSLPYDEGKDTFISTPKGKNWFYGILPMWYIYRPTNYKSYEAVAMTLHL